MPEIDLNAAADRLKQAAQRAAELNVSVALESANLVFQAAQNIATHGHQAFEVVPVFDAFKAEDKIGPALDRLAASLNAVRGQAA